MRARRADEGGEPARDFFKHSSEACKPRPHLIQARRAGQGGISRNFPLAGSGSSGEGLLGLAAKGLHTDGRPARILVASTSKFCW